MALILYTDAYAEVADVDARLIWNAKWNLLSTTEKENRIKAVTLQIDDMMFSGIKQDPGQPLKFPRQFNTFSNTRYFDTGDNVFDDDNQTRTLRKAVAVQVEYELNKYGLGAVSYSIGDESIVPRQDQMCREARAILSPYVKV